MNKILSKSVKKTKITETKSKKLTSKEKQELELIKIKKQNKIFEKATPSEKRIIIAKDVIQQLTLGKIISTPGTYCVINKHLDGDLQKELIKPNVKCDVCALGGLFLSQVRINNSFKINYDNSIEKFEIEDTLHKVFSKEQLDLIEAAYEEWDVKNNYGSLTKKGAFTRKYRTRKKLSTDGLNCNDQYEKIVAKINKEALINIMKNIISNKGSFKPDR